MVTVMDYQSQANEVKPMASLKVGNQFYNLKVGKDKKLYTMCSLWATSCKTMYSLNGHFESL